MHAFVSPPTTFFWPHQMEVMGQLRRALAYLTSMTYCSRAHCKIGSNRWESGIRIVMDATTALSADRETSSFLCDNIAVQFWCGLERWRLVEALVVVKTMRTALLSALCVVDIRSYVSTLWSVRDCRSTIGLDWDQKSLLVPYKSRPIAENNKRLPVRECHEYFSLVTPQPSRIWTLQEFICKASPRIKCTRHATAQW